VFGIRHVLADSTGGAVSSIPQAEHEMPNPETGNGIIEAAPEEWVCVDALYRLRC
jgi:hypothetical protein